MTLAAGANIPIEGREAQVTVRAPDLGGVLVLAEEGGAVRPLTAEDPIARVSGEGRVTIALTAVPDAVDRLRVLAWSSVKTRVLEPAEAEISLDGAIVAKVELKTGQPLRAAELVEVYRRHGNWKVRAVASGWIGGVEAASAAVGIDAGAFQPLRAAARGRRASDAAPRPRRDAGPAVLRALIDEIVGPGERIGGDDYLEFKLAGTYDASVVLDPVNDELTAVTAILPLGAGGPSDTRMAEAAARTSGEAPMGRIAFDGGHVYASVSTVVDQHALDTAVVKALLAEAWTTAHDFARRIGGAWRGVQLPDEPPRELRLGVVEELGEPSYLDRDPRDARGQQLHAARRRAADLPGARRRHALARPGAARGRRARLVGAVRAGAARRRRADPGRLARDRRLEHGQRADAARRRAGGRRRRARPSSS